MKNNIHPYSQQLDFRRGANERVEGVYMEYMTENERVCNKAENSSVKSIKNIFELLLYCLLVLIATDAVATAAAAETFGAMATKIASSFDGVSKLIAGGSYIAGIGFSLGAIMKFKQHKDNPTQIPIGTPISMALIAASLLFFPVVLKIAGMSIFGTTTTAGTGGTIIIGT